MKEAGGEPFPLALAVRVTSQASVWPESTTGESFLTIKHHGVCAGGSGDGREGFQHGAVAWKAQGEGHPPPSPPLRKDADWALSLPPEDSGSLE